MTTSKARSSSPNSKQNKTCNSHTLCFSLCAKEPFNYYKTSFELWYTGFSWSRREVNYTFLTVTKINFFCRFSNKNILQIVDKINFSEVSEELQYPHFRFPQRWYISIDREWDERGINRGSTGWFSKLCRHLSLLETDCQRSWQPFKSLKWR